MSPRTPQNSSDHDLLVTLHEQVRALREEDMPALKSSWSKVVDDHEARLRLIEQRMWLWTGAAGILGSIASIAVNYFLK